MMRHRRGAARALHVAMAGRARGVRRLDCRMSRIASIVREAAVSGALASALSTAVLVLAGRRESRSGAAPLNATSQWLWGPAEAHGCQRTDRRHTLSGYLIHHGACTFWAAMHSAALARTRVPERPLPALAAGAATAAMAALVDLKCTPERLTPGFQHRVSVPALVATYGAFALGLALGGLAVRRARPRRHGQQAGAAAPASGNAPPG